MPCGRSPLLRSMLLAICMLASLAQHALASRQLLEGAAPVLFGEQWIQQYGYKSRIFRFYLAQDAKELWTITSTFPTVLLAARRASFQADMQVALSSYLQILPVRIQFQSDSQPAMSPAQLPTTGAQDIRSYIDVTIEYPQDSPFSNYPLDITTSSAWMLGDGVSIFPARWNVGLAVCDPLDPDYAYTLPFPGTRLCNRVVEMLLQPSPAPAVLVALPGGPNSTLSVSYIDGVMFGGDFHPPAVNVPTTSYNATLTIPVVPMSSGGSIPIRYLKARPQDSPHQAASQGKAMLTPSMHQAAHDNIRAADASGSRDHMLLQVRPSPSPASGLPASSLVENYNNLTYHGGPLMTQQVNVYMIYVGYQNTDPMSYWMNYLVANLGGNRWWQVKKDFYDSTGPVSGKLALAGATYINQVDVPWNFDNSSTEVQVVRSIALTAIQQELVPDDQQNGIYVVLVNSTAGGLEFQSSWSACTQACGWHSSSNGLKFVFLFDCATNHPEGCLLYPYTNNGTTSPSGHAWVDTTATTLAHELGETVTDPIQDGNSTSYGWYDDASGNENEDCCAWEFGDIQNYTIPGQTRRVSYNQLVNGYPYLLQLTYDVSTTPGGDGTQNGCVYGS